MPGQAGVPAAPRRGSSTAAGEFGMGRPGLEGASRESEESTGVSDTVMQPPGLARPRGACRLHLSCIGPGKVGLIGSARRLFSMLSELASPKGAIPHLLVPILQSLMPS